ncbi:uncharacterized protein LOC135804803 [Sycon ciliatum]|uniref:uncharacterized protein LOC135804803 n=1 Tax=Sycon ciliatum TaxID=27933 RepID=UPI0031F67F11
MKLLLTNAFGLLSKFGACQHAVARSRSDIAIVTETKLTPEKASLSDSSMPGFHPPLRLDRSAQGGGVAVWVRDSLSFDHLSDINCHGHEVIWLCLHLDNGQKVVVCAVYRPGSCPGQDVSLLEYLDSVMDQARSLGNSVVIAGDLNVHNESWLCSTKTTPAGEYMEELSAFHGLHQHVTQPTRGENTLDLILSDFSETSVVVNVLDPIGASDHATVVATFDATPLREPPTKRRVWRYAQADWGRLRHFYSTANWDISEDPEASCRSVTAVVMEGMNRFIPHKELSTKPTDPSWWTPECSAATQAKKNAWNRLRRHPTCHQQLIDYNAKVRASANCLRLAKQAESARIRDRLKHGSLRNKQWWSLLKQAAGSGRSSSIPVLRNAQGREYVTNQEKATCFGEFFASKCSLGDQDLQHSDLLDLPPRFMEKIVNTAIINHLEHEKALSIHQYGFRQGLSTSDLLTSLNHSWVSEVNRGGAVRVLAVDIAGAFDKVSHRGVLHKAASYGITGPLLNWLSDYLYDRKLQAVVGGASSEPYKIDAGVPQGSILGPTLFLLYVNDACDVLPEGITPAVYADDTTLYAHIPTPHAVTEVCRNLQAGVDALAEWGAQWRVTFEPTKSQAMTVSRHRRPWETPPIKFNGTAVPECSRLKLLGVTFDAHLTYSEHLRGTAMQLKVKRRKHAVLYHLRRDYPSAHRGRLP